MKYLVYLFYILIAVILITIAIYNRDPATITLTPDWLPLFGGVKLTAPLFALIYIALFAGMALGLFFEYIRESGYRRQARKAKRELKKNEKELQKTKEDAGQYDDDVLAIVEG